MLFQSKGNYAKVFLITTCISQQTHTEFIHFALYNKTPHGGYWITEEKCVKQKCPLLS